MGDTDESIGKQTIISLCVVINFHTMLPDVEPNLTATVKNRGEK